MYAAPAFVCFTTRTAAAITRPNGANAAAASRATGSAAGAVAQLRSRPNTVPAKASENTAVTSERSTGKISSDAIDAIGPNGDTTIRSNVPACSSARSVATGTETVEVRNPTM